MTQLVVRKDGKVWQAAGMGTFTFSGWKSDGHAVTADGRELHFNMRGWSHGRAEIHQGDAVIGTYHRTGKMSHAGTLEVGGETYELGRDGGVFTQVYALDCRGERLASFAIKGFTGTRMEGELLQDVDPVAGLFFLWLIVAFRNDDAAAAAGAGAGA